MNRQSNQFNWVKPLSSKELNTYIQALEIAIV